MAIARATFGETVGQHGRVVRRFETCCPPMSEFPVARSTLDEGRDLQHGRRFAAETEVSGVQGGAAGASRLRSLRFTSEPFPSSATTRHRSARPAARSASQGGVR